MRVAVQALSAVCGGAQSIHTNAFDEALALPTENSVRIALRTQQILAEEAGGTDTADPFGGASSGDLWPGVPAVVEQDFHAGPEFIGAVARHAARFYRLYPQHARAT